MDEHWYDTFFEGEVATAVPEVEQPWTTCRSSNVWAFRTSGLGQDNLEVKFLNGAVYVYYGMGYAYQEMYQAPSKGKWVWRYLRSDGKYSIGSCSYQMIVAGVAHPTTHFGPKLRPPPNPYPGRWILKIHRPKYPKRIK